MYYHLSQPPVGVSEKVISATYYLKSEVRTLDYRLTFTPMTFVYFARNCRRRRNASNPTLLMNILSWNVRKAAGANFRRVFRELVSCHNPNLVILTKTRVSGNRANRIIATLGFESS